MFLVKKKTETLLFIQMIEWNFFLSSFAIYFSPIYIVSHLLRMVWNSWMRVHLEFNLIAWFR